MTGLEKLYNIVLKEQNVLNSSIYAWNSQRDYNMVEYDKARMDELRWIKHVIEDIQKGLTTMNNFAKFFDEVVKTSMRIREAQEHGDRNIVAYYEGRLDAYRLS